jgi:peptidoglycan/LPS O-acetylase OafA/YrhL
VYFYLCFAIWIRKSNPIHASLGLTLTLIANFIIGTVFPATYFSKTISDPIVFEFMFGVLVAMLFKFDVKFNNWFVFFCGLTSLMLGSYLAPGQSTSGFEHNVRFLIWGVPSALLVYSCLGIRSSSKFISLFVYLGGASYSIYLFHPFVMTTYARIIKSSPIQYANMAPVYAFMFGYCCAPVC